MDGYTFRDLGQDLVERFRGFVPVSAYVAVVSVGLWLLIDVVSGVAFLGTFVLLAFVLTAILAFGVGLVEVVAQSERSRLLALAACGWGLISLIVTVAQAMADAFVS